MSAPTGTLTSSMTTAGSVWPVPSATPTPVPPCGDGPYLGGASGTVSLGRYMHTRQTARYNMTFLTESDSVWPGGPSSTPACVPPCESGLHPGGGNGTGWKGTLALETKCTITHITYVRMYLFQFLLVSFFLVLIVLFLIGYKMR